MAASGFHSNQPAGLPVTTSSFSNLSLLTGVASFEREFVPYNMPSSLTSSVRIRHLPLGTTEETVRVMAVFAKSLAGVEVLPPHLSDDSGFCSAILKFDTLDGALEAKEILDGKTNFANSATMTVEIMSGVTSRRATVDMSSATSTVTPVSSGTSSRASSHPSNQMRFPPSGYPTPHDVAAAYGNGTTLPATAAATDLTSTEPTVSTHYQNIFSPQSPIGNHLTEHMRASGKDLINDDSAYDDDTRELLKDPVAYAENGAMLASQQFDQAPAPLPRRATGPSLASISHRMTGLALNTTALNGPTSGINSAAPMSAYGGGNISAVSGMSAGVMGGSAIPQTGYQQQHQHQHPLPHQHQHQQPHQHQHQQPHQQPHQHNHYRNHNLPPANPADQNPPCNTLYVGNLPMDTSEEELKAVFCKQRGYKRLCFRTKQNGPMCFVEFEDISFATKALNEMYGLMLHNSIKGGIRLSFSKNPLGVRSGQNPSQNGAVSTVVPGMNTMMSNANTGGYATVNGPPPGLVAPPGLGVGRNPYINSNATTPSSANGANGTNGNSAYGVAASSYTAVSPSNNSNNNNNTWANASFYQANVNASSINGSLANGSSATYPAFMMGR